MPTSEARLERVMMLVVEALEAQNECMRQQTEALQAMAESNHRLADAIEREQRDEASTDMQGQDLSKPASDDELPWTL
jgi:hypothetical protein